MNDPSPPRRPLLISDAAFQGLAGQFVEMVEPHSESDPVALLVQLLTAFGNAIGRGPHFVAEGDHHHTNLFMVLVGETSKARKGSSWGHVRHVMEKADASWPSRVMSGLSSGEGLIWAVRNPPENADRMRRVGRGIEFIPDEGVSDKRLLVYEPEFATVLRTQEREGNKLSGTVREAWDRGDLRTLTKNSAAVATGAHISIIGHTTSQELRRYLTSTEVANGFGNRFLWISAARSKFLPDGGSLAVEDLGAIVDGIREALKYSQKLHEIRRDEKARELWHRVYPKLSEGKLGLFGALTARAEAQTMRLALIYALLDRSPVITHIHLRAALAVWAYVEKSIRLIFDDYQTGDPLADRILGELMRTPEGLSRTEISGLLERNKKGFQIEQALGLLKETGRATLKEERSGGGRPAERWFST